MRAADAIDGVEARRLLASLEQLSAEEVDSLLAVL
jgi:hypothetical protein